MNVAARRFWNHPCWIGVIGLGFLLVLIVISLCAGRHWLVPQRMWDLLIGDPNAAEALALRLVRLPRTAAALGAGACLAISGALLQRLTKNPLADPGILGISGGAGLAVVGLMATFGRGQPIPAGFIPLAAISGALAATVLVTVLIRRAGTQAPITVILVGIAIGATTGAISQALAVSLDPSLLRFAIAWQAGTLAGVGIIPAFALPIIAVVGIALAFCKREALDAAMLDDASATSVGVDLVALRRDGLALAAVLAAAAVAWCGGLTFVGFIAPHLVRPLVGERSALLLPMSAVAGACLLLTADCLGRSILPFRELPAGILLGAIGAPAFLVILARWGKPR